MNPATADPAAEAAVLSIHSIQGLAGQEYPILIVFPDPWSTW